VKFYRVVGHSRKRSAFGGSLDSFLVSGWILCHYEIANNILSPLYLPGGSTHRSRLRFEICDRF